MHFHDIFPPQWCETAVTLQSFMHTFSSTIHMLHQYSNINMSLKYCLPCNKGFSFFFTSTHSYSCFLSDNSIFNDKLKHACTCYSLSASSPSLFFFLFLFLFVTLFCAYQNTHTQTHTSQCWIDLGQPSSGQESQSLWSLFSVYTGVFPFTPGKVHTLSLIETRTHTTLWSVPKKAQQGSPSLLRNTTHTTHTHSSDLYGFDTSASTHFISHTYYHTQMQWTNMPKSS